MIAGAVAGRDAGCREDAGRKRKPDPCGPGCSFAGAGPAITFQRGTLAGAAITIWEKSERLPATI
jgi:hypothetical protein